MMDGVETSNQEDEEIGNEKVLFCSNLLFVTVNYDLYTFHCALKFFTGLFTLQLIFSRINILQTLDGLFAGVYVMSGRLRSIAFTTF